MSVSIDNMKLLLPVLVLIITELSEGRVATSETDVKPLPVSDVKDRTPLNFPCKFRTLQGGDPYPSVVVRWQGKIQRLTWGQDGQISYEQNYIYPTQSHAYPSSGGLSGDSGTTYSDPFGDASVVPDDYLFGDIVAWFSRDCKRPY